MTEREQELRCVISDLRDQLQDKDDLLDAAYARIAELERLNLSFATNEQELAKYRNEKNWTRPFDINGKLMEEHALYLPKVMK